MEQVLSTISSLISKLRLRQISPVGVAVSGGRDSVVLTHLAKKLFNNVIAITIDHQLTPESHKVSLRAGEIVRNIGAKHELITLSWSDGRPDEGRIQSICHTRRIETLLNVCQYKNIKLLLLGDHLNNQIDMLLYRIARESGTDGLSCMLPLTKLPGYPNMILYRPLLYMTDETIQELSKGLEWIDKPTNTHIPFWSNTVTDLCNEYPYLVDGLTHVNKVFAMAKLNITREVCKALDNYMSIDSRLGYAVIEMKGFLELSHPVAFRVLTTLLQFVEGKSRTFVSRNINFLYNKIKSGSLKSNFSLGRCSIFRIDDQYFGVAYNPVRKIDELKEEWTPINVGETVHWQGRFCISLLPLKREGLSLLLMERKEVQTLYIRNMVLKDENQLSKGIRRNRNYKIPNKFIRFGLPVIVDEEGNVVIMPHFEVIDKSYGLRCECSHFKPKVHWKEWAGYDNLELNSHVIY